MTHGINIKPELYHWTVTSGGALKVKLVVGPFQGGTDYHLQRGRNSQEIQWWDEGSRGCFESNVHPDVQTLLTGLVLGDPQLASVVATLGISLPQADPQ